MKSMTKAKMWCFALGQLGWSILSGLISNWLVYFYQPDAASIQAGQTVFIPQGLVIGGILTIIGLITAVGRIFDAVTDPMVAYFSDRCTSKLGRRIPFLKWIALPFGIVTIMVFMAPVQKISTINSVWLFIFIALYYLCITMYCTPFNALIAELGHTQKERLDISTYISLTFIVGTAIAYMSPVIWNIFEPSLGRVTAMRLTFTVLGAIGTIFLFVPVFTIREKDYAEASPVSDNIIQSLGKTFAEKNFRIFVGSDLTYFIGLTMFQTGLPFFVTALLKLPEQMSTVLFVVMTACSLVFYPFINSIVPKVGKKRFVLFAFLFFTIVFAVTGFCGDPLCINHTAQGFIIVIAASLPMAIFGILPQAIVADVAQYNFIRTGENRDGMFYAARTFCFKLGQSLAMLLFTSFATVGKAAGTGYRLVALVAAAFLLAGGIVMLFFNEKKITTAIKNKRID